MTLRTLCLSLSAPLLAAAACGGDDGHADDEIVLLDDSSDEVVLTLEDLVDRGEVTTDDSVAAFLVSPADGDELSAGEPPTFTWEPRASTLRHGRTTGDYVWLRIDGPGMEAPIDVAAIESTEWTMDEEHWEHLQEATGPCEVQVISAYVDRGIVEEAFQPSSNPTFSVIE
jgi:hypothetical protein